MLAPGEARGFGPSSSPARDYIVQTSSVMTQDPTRLNTEGTDKKAWCKPELLELSIGEITGAGSGAYGGQGPLSAS